MNNEMVHYWNGSTSGWPDETCLRFEQDGAFVLLWSGPGQCDWWITAESMGRLTSTVSELLPLSNLRAALWSNDPVGEDLRRQLQPTDPG